MLKFHRSRGAAVGIVFFTATVAQAGEYQCRLADSSVRIAVEVKKEGHTLPCEVVSENDRNERTVLFSARYDRGYCPARLEHWRSELESQGWVCQISSEDYVVQGTGRILSADELTAIETTPVASTGDAVISARRSCRLDGKSRRIRIEVDNPNQGTPCSLIYWSEDDRSESGQLLWRAQHDPDFCPSRLDFIIEKWIAEGWQCDDGSAPADVETVRAEIPAEAVTRAEADSTTEAEAGVTIETAAIDNAPPESPETTAPEAVSREPSALEQPLLTDTTLPETDPEDTLVIESETVPVQADVVEDRQSVPLSVDPALQAIIEADAKKIGEWMDVEPVIEVKAYGDLNSDGADDAIILLSYQSGAAAYRQYLMSYLVTNDGYELAGVKLLTGVSPPPYEAKVRRVSDGIIWLTIPNDSGQGIGSFGYALEDQQFVEVEVAQDSETVSN